MIGERKLVERRKHKRFQAPKGAFVGIRAEDTKVGRVSDVSIGGLGFSYVGTEKPSPSKGSYLDLFFTDKDFHLGRLPFKTISDHKSVEKAPPFSSETMRRCGVKFKKLTRHQKAELERFIQNHAIGEAYFRGESPFSTDKEVPLHGSFLKEKSSSTSSPQAAPKGTPTISYTELGDHDFFQYSPIFQLLGLIGFALWGILCLVANVDSFRLLVLFTLSVFWFMVPGLGLIYVFKLWNYLRGNPDQRYTTN
jgi:hypothetical protein